MTVPAILVLPVFLGLIFFVVWALFVSVPRDMRSIFRHKMWQVRDDAMDEIIRCGKSEDTHRIGVVVNIAELLIAIADDLTLFGIVRFLMFPPIWTSI